jgi:hypothetical protein
MLPEQNIDRVTSHVNLAERCNKKKKNNIHARGVELSMNGEQFFETYHIPASRLVTQTSPGLQWSNSTVGDRKSSDETAPFRPTRRTPRHS